MTETQLKQLKELKETNKFLLDRLEKAYIESGKLRQSLMQKGERRFPVKSEKELGSKTK
jgi:hypothetical protein|tara:strand:+ start:151 stop:327 length:177 start_codon:yes stop_codon:yes gene_type:complete